MKADIIHKASLQQMNGLVDVRNICMYIPHKLLQRYEETSGPFHYLTCGHTSVDKTNNSPDVAESHSEAHTQDENIMTHCNVIY